MSDLPSQLSPIYFAGPVTVCGFNAVGHLASPYSVGPPGNQTRGTLGRRPGGSWLSYCGLGLCDHRFGPWRRRALVAQQTDRKSTRLNSSHANISYAVFCLKKNKKQTS